MRHWTKPIATTLAGLTLLATTGCYSVTVQGADLAKPVSVSRSTGERARVTRQFKHEMVSWYLLGILPIGTLPAGPASVSANAENVTAAVVREELNKGGNGVVDLKVTTQYDLLSFVYGIVAGIIPIPIRGTSVIVEGKIVD